MNKSKHPALNDPTKYIESARKKESSKIYKDICLDCYIAEYNDQRDRKIAIIEQYEEIANKKIEDRRKKIEDEKRQSDSIYNSKFTMDKEKPYDRFLLAMDMLGKNNGIKYGQFTVFTGIDEELARIRFSLYLQEIGYTYGNEKKQINNPNFIQEYYVRKIAADKEVNDYIEIKYFYSVNNELPSYNTTILEEDYPCWLINKVVIGGTANTIINLYLSYWSQSRKTIGGDKIGEIASHVFMGDNISLQYIGYNKYRIEITSKGMDYYTGYKILERYNNN